MTQKPDFLKKSDFSLEDFSGVGAGGVLALAFLAFELAVVDDDLAAADGGVGPAGDGVAFVGGPAGAFV